MTEYVDEYYKKMAGRTGKVQVMSKRLGTKPDWLTKIENLPAPKVDDETLRRMREESLGHHDYQVCRLFTFPEFSPCPTPLLPFLVLPAPYSCLPYLSKASVDMPHPQTNTLC